MKRGLASIALIVASNLGHDAFAQSAEDPLLVESRAIVDEFARTLQGALQRAMSESGPAASIDVCKIEAIEISSELSRRHGAKVGRTSLKTRNPLNLPERWQTEVLTSFDIQVQSEGTQAPAPEYFSRETEGTVRYMRAIPTGGVCLVCHGTTIPADVAARLEHEYPFDIARGYKAGDVRGAFSIIWPQLPKDALLRGQDGSNTAAQ